MPSGHCPLPTSFCACPVSQMRHSSRLSAPSWARPPGTQRPASRACLPAAGMRVQENAHIPHEAQATPLGPSHTLTHTHSLTPTHSLSHTHTHTHPHTHAHTNTHLPTPSFTPRFRSSAEVCWIPTTCRMLFPTNFPALLDSIFWWHIQHTEPAVCTAQHVQPHTQHTGNLCPPSNGHNPEDTTQLQNPYAYHVLHTRTLTHTHTHVLHTCTLTHTHALHTRTHTHTLHTRTLTHTHTHPSLAATGPCAHLLPPPLSHRRCFLWLNHV